MSPPAARLSTSRSSGDMASQGRNTNVRDKHRSIIRKGEPPCGICGEPIDYNAPHLDPGEFTVDHIVPLSIDPSGDVLSNKQAAHRHCNRQAGAKLKGDYAPAVATWTTARDWWSAN